MKISIVMASFNRVELLKLGLSSLWEQAAKHNAEIVVVNDGIARDGTQDVCASYANKVNIKYVFSGQRNKTEFVTRNPCIPNNIAFRQSSGDMVFLTCPEVYHLRNNLDDAVAKLSQDRKAMVIPSIIHMDNGKYLKCLKDTPELATREFLSKNVEGLKGEAEMPFFLGLWREAFEEIRGYDEDFSKGYACEDNDLVERLVRQGLHYERVDMDIVHLFHGRDGSVKAGQIPRHLSIRYNMNYFLLSRRRHYNVRNPRKWGEL